MKKLLRTSLVVLASGVLVTTVGYGAASADSHDHGQVSVDGQGSSFGSFDFHASADSDDPSHVDGYFTGTSPGGPFITWKGPITCLSVQGNRAGFIYRMAGNSTPPLLTGQEVKVSIEDNGGHGKDKITFGLAMPAGTQHGCTPDSAMNPVSQGHTSVHGDDD
jgi:hypothetical protein